MRLLLFPLLVAITLFDSCSTKTNHSTEEIALYKATYFKNADGTIGFDILKSGKVFVHQPILPGAPGNRGFSSESDAKKVALLMIHKMNMGILPPTISLQELDSLAIIY